LAEEKLNNANFVAIFVEEDLYDGIKWDIERYAKTYIQQQISNSKALVFPINVSWDGWFSAKSIVRILENIYFWGLDSQASSLNWIVLVWDIPLPVVNYDSFIYPSIYPYVDFEEQQFIYDADTDYFIFNGNKSAQPDIWHWILQFDNKEDYKSFFDKLRKYYQNPVAFVDKKIWYDDFVANKKFFSSTNLNAYINNFIFVEDISNRRYTNLMLDLLKGNHNSENLATLSNVPNSEALDTSSLTTVETNTVPTMLLQSSISQFLKQYNDLFSVSYMARIRDNVEISDRWKSFNSSGVLSLAMDSHYKKIVQKDSWVVENLDTPLLPMIVSFNDLMEDAIDKKISDNEYYMEMPILDWFHHYEKKKEWNIFLDWCDLPVNDVYKNYYFGQGLDNINSAQDFSIYRWTYRNLNYSNLWNTSISDIQNSNNKLENASVNLDLMSVGGSYWIFSNQIEANRWYNVNSMLGEAKLYESKKIRTHVNAVCLPIPKWDWLCYNWRRYRDDEEYEWSDIYETIEEFAKRNWWGASTINLDQNLLTGNIYKLKSYDYKQAWLPIYDMWWSQSVTSAELDSNSFLGYEKYSSLIKTKDKFWNKTYPKYINWELQSLVKSTTSYSNFDFFSIYNKTTDRWNWKTEKRIYIWDEKMSYSTRNYKNTLWAFLWQGLKDKLAGWYWNKETAWDCKWNYLKWLVYRYMLIDSRVKNDSMSNEQLAWEWVHDYYTGWRFHNSYTELLQYSDKLISTFDAMIDDLSNLNNLLNQIIAYTESKKKILTDFYAYSFSSGTSETSITNWKNKLNSIISSTELTEMYNKAKTMNTTLNNLYLNLESISMSEFDSLLTNLDPSVKFLPEWSQEVRNKIFSVKDKFNEVKQTFITWNVSVKIDNIVTLPSNLIYTLSSKRTDLHGYVEDASGYNIGCDFWQKFYYLCNAISNLKDNAKSSYNDKISDWILQAVPVLDIKDAIVESYFGNDGYSYVVRNIAYISYFFSNNQPLMSEINETVLKVNSIPTINIEDVKNTTSMSFTTKDRPIDSPKYITFQWVGWGLVKFIYPDLYHVEVFKKEWGKLILKNPQEIKNSIKDYLRKIIIDYNQQLKNEDLWKNNFYNSKWSQAFDFLYTLSDLASPKNRNYSLIYPDFLVETLWEQNIDMVAKLLYYQNMPWSERVVWSTISENIALIRDSFDINKKIKFVISNYLKSNNDQWTVLMPTYNWSGYEVAYLNSDWYDYIWNESVPDFVKNTQLAVLGYDNSLKIDSDIYEYDDLYDGATDKKCGINSNWTVDIIERPNAFFCWLDGLKDTVKWELDFGSANSWLYFTKESLEDSFEDYWNERNKYSDKWEELIPDKDADITWNIEKLTIAYWLESGIESASQDWDYELKQVKDFIDWELEIEDSRATSFDASLKVFSTKNFEKNFIVKISTIWENCFKLVSNKYWTTDKLNYDLCSSSNSNNFNRAVDLFAGDVEFKVEGKRLKDSQSVVKVDICFIDSPDLCITKTKSFMVSPWAVKNIVIYKPYDKILPLSQLPIQVFAQDEYWNSIWQEISNYKISVSTWTISYQWKKSTWAIFNNFSDARFVYNPNWYEWSVKISVEPERNNSWLNTIKVTSEIQVVSWNAEILFNWVKFIWSSVIYKLPSNLNDLTYVDNNWLNQLNSWYLSKVSIDLRDKYWNTLSWVMSVSSKNWLLKPGYLLAEGTLDWMNNNAKKISFKKSNSFVINNGKLDFYLYPKFVAGIEEITISISGLKPIIIPIEVKSGDPRKINLTTDLDFTLTNESFSGKIIFYDIWDNIIKDSLKVVLSTFGPLNISWTSYIEKTLKNWELDFSLQTSSDWGLWFIYAYVDTWIVALDLQKPWIQKIMVQDNFLPDSDVNVMYLNLFGSDWWNQWWYFSWKNKYVNKLVSTSEKMLAVTTQLVNPSTIKQMLIWINENWQIQNLKNQEIFIKFDSGNVIYDLGEVWSISFKQEFNLFSGQNFDSLWNLSLWWKNSSSVYYVPEVLDSVVYENYKDWKSIFINWEEILDFANLTTDINVSIKFSNKKYDNKNVWEIYWWDKFVWKIIIWLRWDTFVVNSTSFRIKDWFLVDSAFLWSSTRDLWLWIYIKDSAMPSVSSYKSIESSVDPELNIGFRANFKNITLFGDGRSVWESTVPFASSFLINFGDPLLKRVDKNRQIEDVPFDLGIWDMVFSDPDKNIFKVLNFDFNNDGLQDILVSYTDWSIKILKNYWWNKPYKLLQNLMILSDSIKDIQLWDVDWNWYDDILVWTTANQIRAYVNNKWIFDVDWVLVCLNTYTSSISENPWDISNVSQIFFDYMDEFKNQQNKTLDIVVNDNRWDIKIFYWWSENGRANYLSKLSYTCDTGWYDSQVNNSILVQSFSLNISSQNKVKDMSLVHWLWLVNPGTWAAPDVTNELVWGFDESEIEQMFDTDNFDESSVEAFTEYMSNNWPWSNVAGFDVSGLLSSSMDWYFRYMPSPVERLPIYQNLPREEIYYIPLQYLNSGDKVDIYKQYDDLNWDVLLEWDKVKVTVTIEAKENVKLSYLDYALWPWYVVRNSDKSLDWFIVENNSITNSNKFFIWDVGNENYLYMIDNLILSKSSVLKFSYFLYYRQMPVMQIDLEDRSYSWSINWEISISKDSLLDIILKPVDACAKAMRVFFNNASDLDNYRSYKKVFVDIWKQMSEQQQVISDRSQSRLNDTNVLLSSISQWNSDISSIPWMSTVLESVIGDFNLWDFLNGWTLDFGNITLDNILWSSIDDLEWKMDNVMNWLCGWFDMTNSCSGLPVPFNLDFLSPWNFNIFGCTIKPKFNWVPVFFFPWTIWTPVWTIPFPWWMKDFTDSFYWVPGGVYPSMIRIYVSPTLTMQLGVSICLGPMAAASKIPPLVWDVAWNCIVFALSLPCAQGSSNKETQTYTADIIDSAWWGVCSTPPTPRSVSINWFVDSPFELVSKSQNNNYYTPIVSDGSYFGWMVKFDSSPVSIDKESESLEFIKLESWPEIKNKILWWGGKWLAQCIIKDRVDKQIKYILNNLMTVTIGITLPDLSDVLWDFDKIDFDSLKSFITESNQEVLSEDKKNEYIQEINKNIKTSENADVFEKVSVFAKNSFIQNQEIKNVSNYATNPIESIMKMFEQISLIKLSSQDVVLKIPIITAEDISEYTNYLKMWLEKNQRIVNLWEDSFQKFFGFCAEDDVLDIVDPKNIIQNYQIFQQKYTQIWNLQKKVAVLKSQIENETNSDEKSKFQKELNETEAEISKLERCNDLFAPSNLEELLTFQKTAKLLIDSIRKNIETLDKYKKFPIDLYEWVHVLDRYLSEASALVSSFVHKLTEWLYKNAIRYSQYVDAIVLMVWMIKTYQLLIDFSVNWTQQCWTCTTDNYDSYSCKLSFFCPSIPVLPIPPIKIPSVFIDFSHLDLWVDIKLPKLKFVPSSVNLPNIPDLPVPSFDDISFNLPKIPQIPVIPSPPDLPELPSFMPTMKIELPVLPPAPSIPKLSPSIEGSIKVVDSVWKIFCILKWNIWLVAESQLKSKVEQLTQRTRNVPIFDYISQIPAVKMPNLWDVPLQWFDYKIDSYISLRFSFDQAFEFVDLLVSNANEYVNTITEVKQDAVDGVSNYLFGENEEENNSNQSNWSEDDLSVEEMLQKLQWPDKDWDSFEYFKNPSDQVKDNLKDRSQDEIKTIEQKLSPSELKDFEFMTKEEIDNLYKNFFKSSYVIQETWDYSTEVKKLHSTLITLSNYSKSESYQKNIDNVLSFLSNKDRVELNYQWLNVMKKQVDSIISDKRNELKFISDKIINNYDWFLSEVWKNLYQFVWDKNIEASFELPLLELDGNTNFVLKNQENPIKSYLDMNKKEIDWYLSSLENNSPLSLWMTETEYSLSKSYLKNARDKVNLGLNSLSKSNTESNNILLAQSNWWSSSSNSSFSSMAVDISYYVKWLFIPNDRGEFVNVIKSSYFYDSVGSNYDYLDINWDGFDDVLMWDKNNIYIKYANGNNYHWSKIATDSNYYLYGYMKNINNFVNRVDSNWYDSIRGLEVKLWDEFSEVKNFKMKWQSLESLKFSWSNSLVAWDFVDWYLIRFNKRIDTFYDDEQKYYDWDYLNKEKQYVLVLPNSEELIYTGYSIDLYDNWDSDYITDLMTWIIFDTKFYKSSDENININLLDMPRNWLYAQILSLKKSDWIYYPSSVRSNQIVLGRQVSNDTQPPIPEITLERTKINKIVGTWILQEWFVWTHYNLNALWEDNVAVKEMWIREWNKIILTGNGLNKTWFITLTWLLYTWKVDKEYIFGAKDFNENIEEELVELKVDIPEISVKDINYVSENLVNIVAEISQDIDEWFVSFARERKGDWKYISWLNNNQYNQDYFLEPWKKIITWWVYDIGNKLWFIDSMWRNIWYFDPNNWEIKIFSDYLSSVSLNLDFQTHIPRISIIDLENSRVIFFINLPIDSIVSKEIVNDRYEIKDLDNFSYWEFDWWYGVLDKVQNQVIVFVSSSWKIFIPDPFNSYILWTYSFDSVNNTVVYSLKDEDWNWIVKFNFIVKSIIGG